MKPTLMKTLGALAICFAASPAAAALDAQYEIRVYHNGYVDFTPIIPNDTQGLVPVQAPGWICNYTRGERLNIQCSRGEASVVVSKDCSQRDTTVTSFGIGSLRNEVRDLITVECVRPPSDRRARRQQR